jgi:hypothetical protein
MGMDVLVISLENGVGKENILKSIIYKLEMLLQYKD